MWSHTVSQPIKSCGDETSYEYQDLCQTGGEENKNGSSRHVTGFLLCAVLLTHILYYHTAFMTVHILSLSYPYFKVV